LSIENQANFKTG